MAQVYSNCRTPRQGSKVDRHPSIFPSGTGSRHPSLKFSGTGTGTLDTAFFYYESPKISIERDHSLASLGIKRPCRANVLYQFLHHCLLDRSMLRRSLCSERARGSDVGIGIIR